MSTDLTRMHDSIDNPTIPAAVVATARVAVAAYHHRVGKSLDVGTIAPAAERLAASAMGVAEGAVEAALMRALAEGGGTIEGACGWLEAIASGGELRIAGEAARAATSVAASAPAVRRRSRWMNGIVVAAIVVAVGATLPQLPVDGGSAEPHVAADIRAAATALRAELAGVERPARDEDQKTTEIGMVNEWLVNTQRWLGVVIYGAAYDEQAWIVGRIRSEGLPTVGVVLAPAPADVSVSRTGVTSPEELVERLKRVAANEGLRVAYWQKCPQKLLGQYERQAKVIRICAQSPLMDAATAAHELGHHHSYELIAKAEKLPEAAMELIAESTSALVLALMGHTSPHGPVAYMLSKGGTPEMFDRYRSTIERATQDILIELTKPDWTRNGVLS